MIYVGQSSKTPNESKRYLGSGAGHFNNALKKYGKNAFGKEILEDNIQSKEELNNREIYWIAHYKDLYPELVYNIAKGGQGGNFGEDVNKKISKALKGKKHTPEHIAKTRVEFTEEVRKKLSKAQLERFEKKIQHQPKQ